MKKRKIKKFKKRNKNIKFVSHDQHANSSKKLLQLFKKREDLRKSIDVLVKRNDAKLNITIQNKSSDIEAIDSQIMNILIETQISNPEMIREYTDAHIEALEKDVVESYNKKIDDLKDEIQDDIISAVTGEKTGTTDTKFINIIKNKLKRKKEPFVSKYNNVSDMMRDEDSRISQRNKIQSSYKKIKEVKSFSGRKNRILTKFKAKMFRLNPLKTRKGIQSHIEYLESEKDLLEDYAVRLKHSRFLMMSKASRKKRLMNVRRQIRSIDKIIEQNQVMLLKLSTSTLDKIKNLKYIKLKENKVSRNDVNAYISQQKKKKKSKLQEKNIDTAIEIVEELDKAQNKIINSGDLKRVVDVNEQIRDELKEIKENQIIEQDTRKAKLLPNRVINKSTPVKMQAAMVKPEGLGTIATIAAIASAAPFFYDAAKDAVNNYMKDHFGFDFSHETKTTLAKKAQFAVKAPKAAVATTKLLLATKTGIKASQAVKSTSLAKGAVSTAKTISAAGKSVKNSKLITGTTKSAKDMLTISRTISNSLSVTRLAGETTKALRNRVAGILMSKTITKKLGVKIPGGAGTVIGFGLAYARYANGEYMKAAAEVASTILAIFPGIGTALSFAVDAIIIWSDMDEIMDRILAEEAAENIKKQEEKEAYVRATVSKKLSSSVEYKKLQETHQANIQAFNKYIQSGGNPNDKTGKQLIENMNKSGKGINDYRDKISTNVNKNYVPQTPINTVSAGNVDNTNYGIGQIEVGPRYVKYPNGMIKKEGSRSWRNNNLGNIRYGKFAAANGSLGSDNDNYAVFPNYKIGREAVRQLLFNTKTYSGLNAVQAITKYAPVSDNNDTLGYQKFLISKLGSTATKLLTSLNTKEQDAVINAIQKREGYIVGIIVNGKTGQVVKNTPQVTQPTQPTLTQTANNYINTAMNEVKKYSNYFPTLGIGTPTAVVGAGVAAMAKSLVNKVKYVWGGKQGTQEGLIGLDCSGFVQYVIKTQRGIKDFPSSTSTQRSWLNNPKHAIKVNINQLQPEDIIFFNRGTHVGIYVGNDTVIHSSGGSKNTSWNPGKGVNSSKFSSMIKRLPFFAAYRILQGAGNTQVATNNVGVNISGQQSSTVNKNINNLNKTPLSINKSPRENLVNNVSRNLSKQTSSYDKKNTTVVTTPPVVQNTQGSFINNVKEDINSFLGTFGAPTVNL